MGKKQSQNLNDMKQDNVQPQQGDVKPAFHFTTAA